MALPETEPHNRRRITLGAALGFLGVGAVAELAGVSGLKTVDVMGLTALGLEVGLTVLDIAVDRIHPRAPQDDNTHGSV